MATILVKAPEKIEISEIRFRIEGNKFFQSFWGKDKNGFSEYIGHCDDPFDISRLNFNKRGYESMGYIVTVT